MEKLGWYTTQPVRYFRALAPKRMVFQAICPSACVRKLLGGRRQIQGYLRGCVQADRQHRAATCHRLQKQPSVHTGSDANRLGRFAIYRNQGGAAAGAICHYPGQYVAACSSRCVASRQSRRCQAAPQSTGHRLRVDWRRANQSHWQGSGMCRGAPPLSIPSTRH